MGEKKLWFKARRTYGWGWRPVSWEGWLVVAVYCVANTIFTILFLARNAFGKFYAGLAVSTLILLVICYAKGEKPAWKWGDKNKS